MTSGRWARANSWRDLFFRVRNLNFTNRDDEKLFPYFMRVVKAENEIICFEHCKLR